MASMTTADGPQPQSNPLQKGAPPASPPPKQDDSKSPSPPQDDKHDVPKPIPASLEVSESMRRIQDMLSAGKLTTSDLLTFKYKGLVFNATILSDGSLKAKSAQNPPLPSTPAPGAEKDQQPSNPGSAAYKLYSSPSEFASEMAVNVILSDEKAVKPRGKLSINGWEECVVSGRTIASIRSEMLREQRSDAPDLARAERKQKEARDLVAEALGSEAIEEVVATVEKERSSSPPQHEVEQKPILEVTPPDEVPQQVEESKDAKPESSESNDAKLESNEAEKVQTLEKEKDMDGSGGAIEPQEKEDDKAKEPVFERTEKAAIREDEAEAKNVSGTFGPKTDNQEDDNKATCDNQKPQREEKVDSKLPVDAGEKVQHMAGQSIGSGDSQVPSPVNEDKESKSSPEESKAASLQQEILGNSESEAEHSSTPEGEEALTSKKRSRSPPKLEPRKKKRTYESDSPPSGSITPSKKSQERRKSRSEGVKNSKKVDIPSVSDMDVAELDRDAMEAVAVAAQAEKEEANSRARRTTRLAAGKIKQVDYKASANPLVARSVSPGKEADDSDPLSQGNEPVGDVPRSSRRRVAQNVPVQPQRSSRRVAKLRSSNEKETYSNEEQDLSGGRSSSGGNGSDGRGDKNSPSDEMDVDTGMATRFNSRERKRSRGEGSRGEGGAKRTRYGYEIDYESSGKGHGTRGSTRENSVVDPGEVLDLNDPHEAYDEDEDIVEEAGIEERTDANGFTIGDLRIIRKAVRGAESIDPDNVMDALNKLEDRGDIEDAKCREIPAYLRDIVSSVIDMAGALSMEMEVDMNHVLAAVATDAWRLRKGGLRTGFARKATAILRRINKENQLRHSLERSRRKENRDIEEVRGNLEREMESRRKAELDAMAVRVQLCEVTRGLSRERARIRGSKKEAERFKRREHDVRNRLEKTKILVGQLRSGKESPNGAKNTAKQSTPQQDARKPETEDVDKVKQESPGVLGESVTSDDDVDLADKNVSTTSQRQLEMERLRALIAARESEAESFQRSCERERMRFVSALESKNRLESDLFAQKTHASGGHDGGVSGASAAQVLHRSGKETSKKGDKPGGSGGHRNGGASRGKSGNVKASNGPGGVSARAGASTGKPKSGNGKGHDAGKSSKRKAFGKTQTGAGEKV